jgi:hypothetical protein
MSKTVKIIPGCLHDYLSGRFLRPATETETAKSIDAAHHDGGAGVIEVGGVKCYVEGGRYVRNAGMTVADYLKSRENKHTASDF